MTEWELGYDGLLEFVEEPRMGLQNSYNILQEFLLQDKWDLPGFKEDKENKEDLKTFEIQKQDVVKQIQKLYVKYPDKKFLEIKQRYTQFEG